MIIGTIKNFVEGVEGSNYAVIILSTNCINSICANEEIDLIYDKYKNNAMTVFLRFDGLESPCKRPFSPVIWKL